MVRRVPTEVEQTPVISEPIQIDENKDVVLFVTYNENNIIPEHTRDYLRCLNDNKFTIILIRVLRDFTVKPQDGVDFVDSTVLRANEGYDFGAWAHILRSVPDLWKVKLLLMVNDSVYGPLVRPSFDRLIERIRASNADYIGLTDTYYKQYHFQSYFTAIKPSKTSVPIFQQFWAHVVNLTDKFSIIDNYEIPAVAFYRSKNLRCEALFPISEWGNTYNHNENNPVLHCWKQLYDHGFPFVKVELLRDLLQPNEWQTILGNSGYDLNKINSHLRSYPHYLIPKAPTPKPPKANHLLKSLERFLRPSIKKLKPLMLLPAINTPLTAALDPKVFSSKSSIAILLHVYYIDLLDEFLSFIQNISFPCKLYISTDTEQKSETIRALLEGRYTYEIRLCPNRGRDVAPKFITFADVYSNHEYFLQLHTKKTLYDKDIGVDWRGYLLRTLIGSSLIVESNLKILSSNDIGIVYPRYFSQLSLSSRWTSNFINTQFLLKEFNISIDRDKYFDFPAGSMYWGKSEAILPLVNLKLSFDDFPEENGQKDGTLAHAIERSILFIAEQQGYLGQQIAPVDFLLHGYKFLQVNNRLSLEEAIRLSRKIIRKLEQGPTKRIA